MTTDEKPLAHRLRETVFCICRDFSLTRAHRLEVASFILNREVSSFRDLDIAELSRMVDAFQGARYIATIKQEQRRGQRT